MKRRTFTVGVGSLLSFVAGCTGGGDSTGETTSTESVDSGVVFDATLSDLREEQVTLASSQRILVEVSQVGEGEELLFMLGDGSKFVHREHIRENKDAEFPVESDGWHNIKLSPKRNEAPMDKDVEIHATVTLTEP